MSALTSVRLGEQQLLSMQKMIGDKAPFCIRQGKNGYEVLPLGIKDRLLEFIFSSCKSDRLASIAGSLAETLKASDRCISLNNTENGVEVRTAKLFCKTLDKKSSESPSFKLLQQELLASRLGIPSKAFSVHPDFEAFSSKNYLYNYVRPYNETLHFDEETGDLKIKYNNELTSWSTIPSDVRSLGDKKVQLPADQKRQPWIYGPSGIQQKDMYDWTELTPFKYEDPSQWGHRWILEICACNEETPRKTGDHSWFRLKTPTGEIYSIGLYRPEKSGFIDNFKAPLKIKKGRLMQPDLSEYYPCNIHSFEYKIDEEIFQKIKAQVEADKREDKQPFQAMENNCTQYVNKIAKIAGISLPTKKRIWKILLPKPCKRFIKGIAPHLPDLVKKICDIAAALLINLVLVCLGATASDPTQPTKPLIASFWDLFDPEKASLHHPHTLGHKVERKIAEWRLRKTLARPDKAKKIAYRLPPEYIDRKRKDLQTRNRTS